MYTPRSILSVNFCRHRKINPSIWIDTLCGRRGGGGAMVWKAAYKLVATFDDIMALNYSF